MLIFIQLVKRLGNVERMVANALIIGQDFLSVDAETAVLRVYIPAMPIGDTSFMPDRDFLEGLPAGALSPAGLRTVCHRRCTWDSPLSWFLDSFVSLFFCVYSIA